MGDKNSGRADIIISVAMQMKDTAKKLDAQIKKATRNAGTNMGKNLRKEMSGAKAFEAKMFELKQILPKKQFDAVNKEYSKLGRSVDSTMSSPLKRLNIAHKKVAGQMKVRTKKLQGSFKAWALSIMFFGMAIQRAMTSIWKFGSKTFNEINHSVEGTTTGFDMLQGSLKFLGFTIGAALEPLAMKLIPIVEGIAEWVSKNEKLTASLVKWGTIFGGLLFVAGTVILGLGGVATAFNNIVDATKTMKKGFNALKNANYAKMWTTMKTSIVRLGNYLGGALKGNIKWIRANPIKSIIGGLVVTGIVTAFLWLNKLQKSLGGWDKLFESVGNGLKKIMAMMSASMTATIMKAKDMWKAIRGKETSGLSYMDIYGAKLEENLKIANFKEPLNGWVEDSRTLAEIWKGDLYPQIEELEGGINGVNEAIKGVSFSSSDIESLWSQNMLKPERIEALLGADAVSPNTVDDSSESLLQSLYKQETGTTFVIDKISINTDANNINDILESLKSYV